MSERCTGHSKRTKKPCGNSPMHGSTVCRMHGGGTPQARAKARQRQVETAARKQLAQLDVAPVSDPLTTLAELAGQALAFKDVLADRVNEIKAIRYRDHKGAEQLRSEVALWERALDRCERFVSAMAKLNIDERLAKVSEQQAAMLTDALAAALGEMGLTYDQQREARSRVASHLRVATG